MPNRCQLGRHEEVTALEYAVLHSVIALDTIRCTQRASCQTWKQTQATSRRASTQSCKSDLKGPCRQESYSTVGSSTVATEAVYRSHEEFGLPWE